MSDKKYIVKNLAPWMIDELLVLSRHTSYELLLLREQKEFYGEDLNTIRQNGVSISYTKKSYEHFARKMAVVLRFLVTNLFNFRFNYSFVIGIKSIFWFLELDLSKFSPNSTIHVQFATQPAVLALLIKKYFNDEPQYFFTFHAHDIYFDNKWFKPLIAQCTKAFSISDYNIEYVKDKFIDSDKIELSRLGVFRNSTSSDKKRNTKEFYIGLISWFTEKKGIRYLLEAMLQLREEKDHSIKLLLAGDGPKKEEIISFISNHGLENSIDYYGKLKGEAKTKFFQKLDAFVLPSITLNNDKDGIPVVLMEAISYGLPIISTNVSGIPEICVNEFNGYLIEEKSADALADAIIKLYNDPNKKEVFAKNAIEMSTKYDIETNTLEKARKMQWLSDQKVAQL
ncbi:MAG: glycosyltransferase family 4 protein [Flavobacteriaceae bacterium]|nr:glycosyltransferase family 4 protein [Flavobacteriaceae bacterium]